MASSNSNKTLKKKKKFQKEKSVPTFVPNTGETVVVRLKKIDGKVYQDCDVYIGPKMDNASWKFKESPWVNNFHYATSDRVKNLQLYAEHILATPDLREHLYELKGKRLGCFCENLKFCHGTVLVSLVNKECASREVTNNLHYFFKGEENPLSNLYRTRIGTSFNSEQIRVGHMIRRLKNRTELMNELIDTKNNIDLCKLSKTVFRTLTLNNKYLQEEQLLDMIRTLRSKLIYCKNFEEKLEGLGETLFIFEATQNPFWGCGKDIQDISAKEDIFLLPGENWLGWLLLWLKHYHKGRMLKKGFKDFKEVQKQESEFTEEEKLESKKTRETGLQMLKKLYDSFSVLEKQSNIAEGLQKVINCVSKNIEELVVY